MGGFGRFLAWTLIPGGIVVGVLRAFVFEPWVVPNDEWLAASIAPTLAPGDRVLLLTRGTPSIGDLVRCKDPEVPTDFVIGRIVAKGGDTVDIQGAMLKVNGYGYVSSEACADGNASVVSPKTQQRVDVVCGRVEMAGGWHFIGRVPKAQPEGLRNFKVEPGSVFLASDNRELHDDSRDFGSVPLSSCDRRIVFRPWGAKGWGDDKKRMTLIR